MAPTSCKEQGSVATPRGRVQVSSMAQQSSANLRAILGPQLRRVVQRPGGCRDTQQLRLSNQLDLAWKMGLNTSILVLYRTSFNCFIEWFFENGYWF